MNFKPFVAYFLLAGGLLIPQATTASPDIQWLQPSENVQGVPATLPTGATEFEVDGQKIPVGNVVNAADFGVSVEVADNTPYLNQAIQHCRGKNGARLVLPKGIYRFGGSGSVKFHNLKDLEFDGGGSTLVFSGQVQWNIEVLDSQRILLRNFNYDWDYAKDPIAIIVQIVRKEASFFDLKFLHYEDFPKKEVRFSVFSGYDMEADSVGYSGAKTLYLQFYRHSRKPALQWLSGNVVRVHTPWQEAQAGEFYRAQHFYYDYHGFLLRNNQHLSLEDINIYAVAGYGLFLDGTAKYTSLRRVRLTLPKGDPKRCITTAADGFHIARSQGFLKVEDCEIGYGGDDCINVHDCSGFGRKIDSNTLRTTKFWYSWTMKAGDPIELRYGDMSSAVERTVLKSIKPVKPEEGTVDLEFADPIPEPLAATPDFVFFDWRYDSRNVILRNCIFHRNRARGILVSARDVTVENCRFYRNERGAVKMGVGYSPAWSEGYGIRNVLFRNNSFEYPNTMDMAYENRVSDVTIGLYCGTDGVAGNSTNSGILDEIAFVNNSFKDSPGYIASILAATNVTFCGNTFENSTWIASNLPYRGAFWLDKSINATFIGNRWIPSAYLRKPGVTSPENATQNLLWQKNSYR